MSRAVVPLVTEHERKRDPLDTNLKSVEKLTERLARNNRGYRSTPKATDLWTKTTKNSPNPKIDPKANWGSFWWDFRFLRGIKEKFGGKFVINRALDTNMLRG